MYNVYLVGDSVIVAVFCLFSNLSRPNLGNLFPTWCVATAVFAQHFYTWLPRGRPHVCVITDNGQPAMARRLWFSGQQGFHSLPGARCATWGGDSGLPGSASELEPLTPSLCAHANSRQPGGPIQSLLGAAWRADGDRLPHCISRMASFIFWFICWPVISQDCDLRVADYCLPWGVCL